MAEISAIEEQLNGVEKYAMIFMEQENSEIAAEQLRAAEVSVRTVVGPASLCFTLILICGSELKTGIILLSY